MTLKKSAKFSVDKQHAEENAHLINKSKLEDFLRAIIQNRNLIEEAIEDSNSRNASYTNQLDTILNWCLNIKEKLKCAVALIYSIHFEAIEKCVETIEFCEKSLRQYQTGRVMKEKQPLMSMSVDLNSEGSFEISTGGATDSNLLMVYANLLDVCNDSMHAMGTFLNCAAASFYWPFRLTPVYSKTTRSDGDSSGDRVLAPSNYESVEQLEIIQAEEKVAVYFNSLSRLSGFLTGLSAVIGQSNTELYLKFSVCYGVKQLDSAVVKLDKLEKFLSKKVDFCSIPHR